MTDRDLDVRRYLSTAIDDVPIDVENRLSELRSGGGPKPGQHRFAVGVVALAVAAAGFVLAGRAFLDPPGTVASGVPAQPILFERWEMDLEAADPFSVRIWSVREDGTRAGPLSQPAGNNTEAVWSPDGSRIAFVGSNLPDRETTLWVMNPDGTGLTALTDDFGVDMPAWSPDGKQIAFAGQDHPDPAGETAGPIGIWVVPTGGGEPRLVLEGHTWTNPSWSPDGTRLVVVGMEADDDPLASLYTVRIDGSQLTRITSEAVYYASPEWSPDGTRIAYASSTGRYNSDIYVMNADGSELLRLTDWEGSDGRPVWSSDGQEILFTSDRGATLAERESKGLGGLQGLAIYVMDADGSDVRLVYDDGAMQNTPTSWSR
jgi:Tol biopolymer transport system component